MGNQDAALGVEQQIIGHPAQQLFLKTEVTIGARNNKVGIQIRADLRQPAAIRAVRVIHIMAGGDVVFGQPPNNIAELLPGSFNLDIGRNRRDMHRTANELITRSRTKCFYRCGAIAQPRAQRSSLFLQLRRKWRAPDLQLEQVATLLHCSTM